MFFKHWIVGINSFNSDFTEKFLMIIWDIIYLTKKNHIINYSNYHGIEFKKDSVPFFLRFSWSKRRIYISYQILFHERMVDYMKITNCIEPVDTFPYFIYFYYPCVVCYFDHNFDHNFFGLKRFITTLNNLKRYFSYILA